MIRFLASIILLGGLLGLLGKPFKIGNTSIPPIGKVVSPFTGFLKNAQIDNNKANQSIKLKTPSGSSVKVVFDDRMVPHIFAQNTQDAYFVQGYITATQRLWQMDLSARATEGRLSEILGQRTLQYDRRQRQLGLAHASKKAEQKWKENKEIYANLEAYAAGVNAYIGTLYYEDLPVEYKLMDFQPQSWSPYRTALFTKSMAAKLCVGQKDIEHSTMRKLLGKGIFDDIFPMQKPNASPVISYGTTWNFDPVAIPDDPSGHLDIGAIGPAAPFSDNQLGSNNWAVSGSLTQSGAPILCNDPHLQLNLPSIWFECHIVTPEYNCYGVSLPGMPGIIIGFNEDIAWGITNTGHDVMDWYKINWVNDAQTQYWLDEKKMSVEFHEEIYQVKGGDPVVDSIRYTVWGPVTMSGTHKDLAMKWMAMESPVDAEAGTFLGLNQAKSFQDYLRALDNFVAPAQNIIFASKQGDIALRVSGQLPLRKSGQGIFVQDGSSSRNDWPGYIPVRHNPMEVNPVRNFVSSANQISTDSTYPYFYHGEPYFEDYRGRWLNKKLSAMKNVTVKDMMALQLNNHSLKAAEILPLFLEVMDSTGINDEQLNADIIKQLKEWDYTYEASLKEPIYFDLWYKHFYQCTWDEFYDLRDSIPVAWPQSWRTIDLAHHNPDHSYFDYNETEKKESAGDIIRLSFDKMIEEVQKLNQLEMKNWGSRRKTRINHLAAIPAFSRTLTKASGHGDALNATTGTSGPSWRMIVELTDPVNAWVVYPGGQSGHPGDPYYDQMVQDWENGKYHQVHFVSTPEELKEATIYSVQFVTQ